MAAREAEAEGDCHEDCGRGGSSQGSAISRSVATARLEHSGQHLQSVGLNCTLEQTSGPAKSSVSAYLERAV